MFQAADANGDGRLDRGEFGVLMSKIHEEAKDRGTYVDRVADHEDRMYSLYNEISGGEEGFTLQDQLALSGKMMDFYNEIKAADEGAWLSVKFTTY